jgi:hypothetical protein
MEGVTCCVLVAWQGWLPALPRWSPLLSRGVAGTSDFAALVQRYFSPSLMRSITIRRYPSEAKFDAPTDFDKTKCRTRPFGLPKMH